MILSVLLLITTLAAGAFAVHFFSRNKQLVSQLERAQLLLQQETLEKERSRIAADAAAKEIDLYREQLKYEREKKTTDESQLREQLTAIANDVVRQGNTLIRSENRDQLEQLLLPFREKLLAFESEVRDSKEKGLQQFASMEGLVKALSEQHSNMNMAAQSLADALKGEQKTQGNWGEMALERILEMSGLRAGSEYEKQVTLRDENNTMHRPDFLIRLPENKHIIVDSKVSLTAFERYVNAENDEVRKNELKLHVLSINSHVKQLGEKNYSQLSGLQTPEFVLLFLPMEGSFALAIREEPDIYMRAWEKRVVIVTPSTLLATLKTIESIWKQERQNINAEKIALEAGRLYDKFTGFLEDLKRIEKSQNDVNKSFRDAFGKLAEGPGNVIGKVEMLKKLGAKAAKRIDPDLLREE